MLFVPHRKVEQHCLESIGLNEKFKEKEKETLSDTLNGTGRSWFAEDQMSIMPCQLKSLKLKFLTQTAIYHWCDLDQIIITCRFTPSTDKSGT